MNINYEYNGVKASEQLETFVSKKLDKVLERYYFVNRVDVFIQKENTSSSDTGHICKIRLSVPGPRLFSEASLASFEAAIAETVSELERQLRKRKEKMQSY